MSLRKFREFIQDGHRPASRRSELNVLEEEMHDSEIADAATVIIGSELSASERSALRDSFVNDIKKMSEGRHNYCNGCGVGVKVVKEFQSMTEGSDRKNRWKPRRMRSFRCQ